MKDQQEKAPEYVIEGKSIDRVPKHYHKYPDELKAQYNMLLPDGINCGTCYHSVKCKTIFDGNDNHTSCQFYPSRFSLKSASI